MEMRYDEPVEVKFLNEQIVRLQKELLEMEYIALPDSEKLLRDVRESITTKKKQLEDFRVRKIRAAAVIEEAKQSRTQVKKEGAE
jgi:hypothetical protein